MSIDALVGLLTQLLAEHTTLVTALTIAAGGLITLRLVRMYHQAKRDPQRLFSPEQRRTLLRQAGWQCEHKELAGKRCPKTYQLQADHIIPWTKGGATQLWNGQILCRSHNASKSNHIPGALYRWRLNRLRRRDRWSQR